MSDTNCFNKKILVVEDLPVMRADLVLILKEIGFTDIEEAVDGKDAWEKLKFQVLCDAPYELIITDIYMPNMNGLTLLKYARSLEIYKKIPIIMISTENEKGIILKAITEGATSYILKPYDALLVKERLLSILLPKKTS